MQTIEQGQKNAYLYVEFSVFRVYEFFNAQG